MEFCKPEVVDRVLAECGCLEKRRRRFPARLVVYVTLLMCLFGTLSYQKLMYQVAKAAPRSGAWPVPNKSSFCRARAKLGWQVMEGLFRALARPLADERASDSFWRGLRVMAIDGTTIALAETPANAAFFGGQTNQDGMRMGPPQLKTVQLLECGTHAIVDAEAGSYRVGEHGLAARLVRSVGPGTVLLADRGLVSVELWKRFVEAGAELVWRAQEQIASRPLEFLPDGSYLARLASGHKAKPSQAVTVRVIEYVLEGSDTIYRLLTSMLDPRLACAEELAALYAERWEIEGSFDEFKTHQGAGRELRSQTPDGVRQEFWAHCVVHQLTRQLTYQAAMQIQTRDPDRISFTLAQDALRRSIGAVKVRVRRLAEAVRQAIQELVQRRNLIVRRNRQYPRLVRRKQFRYRSRPRHQRTRGVQLPRKPAIYVCGSQIA